jgi:hypothetical protein
MRNVKGGAASSQNYNLVAYSTRPLDTVAGEESKYYLGYLRIVIEG